MGQRTAVSVALVVEDDPILCQDLVDQFETAGWFVLAANSAESSLSLLQRGYEIGIAVIDVRLSGNMNGLELARVLRALGCHAPIIYMSGSPVDHRQMVADSIYRSKPIAAGDMVEISRDFAAQTAASSNGVGD